LPAGKFARRQGFLPARFRNSNIACLVLGTVNWDSMAIPCGDRNFAEEQLLQGLRTILVISATCFASACSNVDTCEEPAFYEYAEGGKRIEAPDDLDNLAASKELQIPEASPRPPRDRSEGCLDRPPTLRVDRPGDADET